MDSIQLPLQREFEVILRSLPLNTHLRVSDIRSRLLPCCWDVQLTQAVAQRTWVNRCSSGCCGATSAAIDRGPYVKVSCRPCALSLLVLTWLMWLSLAETEGTRVSDAFDCDKDAVSPHVQNASGNLTMTDRGS